MESEVVEERVRDLEINQEGFRVQIVGFEKALAANTEAVTELTAAMNKGKGAWAILILVGTIIGFVINFIAGFFQNGH